MTYHSLEEVTERGHTCKCHKIAKITEVTKITCLGDLSDLSALSDLVVFTGVHGVGLRQHYTTGW